MKITIESTDRIVTVEGEDRVCIPARLWEGKTDSGIKVQCLIVRIAAHKGEDLSQFERELQEQRTPSSPTMAFPLHLIL